MTYGVTLSGFVRKTREEILNDLQEKLKAEFGSDLVLEPDQPLGIISGIVADAASNLWEATEGAYNAYDPDNAFGNGLSDLVQINNLKRGAESSTTVELLVEGVSGTVIPIGSLCASNNTVGDIIKVQTTEEVVLEGEGIQVAVPAICTVSGVVEIPADFITVIDTPIFGWNSVNNPHKGDTGELEETDVQLRARRAKSVAEASTSSYDAIYTDIDKITNVKYVKVYENDSDTTDPVTNTPAGSFQCVVQGGLDEDIGKAIATNKPVGILPYGTTQVTIPDVSNTERTIGFTRPTSVPIYVEVTVKARTPISATLLDDIKTNIITYAKGELFSDRGYGVNDAIPVSQLMTPINRVDGVDYVEELKVDKVPSPTKITGKVEIAYNEVSEWLPENINVIIQ